MAKSLYLINPRSLYPSYFGAEAFQHFGLEPAHSIADLAVTTIAAFAPEDWRVELCDEYIQPVDLDTDADFIGITGKITQGTRMLELAAEFRNRGKTVIIGGPYASLSPGRMRGHCDILVVGEFEGIAADFFADLERGDWQEEYTGTQPELSTSPLPRWDLYPNDRALSGCVQTSRGCPFECEFCDVIQYLGRKQRHKPVDQILAELDVLYDIGYREVFLADDNLTVYRKRAKEILAAVAEWNLNRPEGPMSFSTQVSIDAARDPELMDLLARAGLLNVFIGIETPNPEALKETKKRQNLKLDLHEQIEVFLDHGVAVQGGMIVGFDSDGLDIFQTQFDFAMAAPVPTFTVGALVAPEATPLHERMETGGRLVEGSETAGSPWDTNVIPNQMSREQLFDGLKWLGNQLYSPENFTQRVLNMIEALGPRRGALAGKAGAVRRQMRPVDAEAVAVVMRMVQRGDEEKAMWNTVRAAVRNKPESEEPVMRALFQYAQIRCLYEAGQFWEPRLGEAGASVPVAASPPPAVSGPLKVLQGP